MTPKHESDDELKSYLFDEDLRKLVDSVPPPAEVSYLEKTIEERFDTPTGVHDFRKLQNLRQTMILDRVKDKLSTEHELRMAAEEKVKAILKWLSVTSSGIVVILVATGIVWLIAQANKVK
jgi:hypothetical protein